MGRIKTIEHYALPIYCASSETYIVNHVTKEELVIVLQSIQTLLQEISEDDSKIKG